MRYVLALALASGLGVGCWVLVGKHERVEVTVCVTTRVGWICDVLMNPSCWDHGGAEAHGAFAMMKRVGRFTRHSQIRTRNLHLLTHRRADCTRVQACRVRCLPSIYPQTKKIDGARAGRGRLVASHRIGGPAQAGSGPRRDATSALSAGTS